MASCEAPAYAQLRSLQLCACLTVHTCFMSDTAFEEGQLPPMLAQVPAS